MLVAGNTLKKSQCQCRSCREAKNWQLSEENILFRNGELNLLVPGSGCHRRGRGMGGQDGLRADADVR